MPKLVYHNNPFEQLKARDYDEGATIAEMLRDVGLPASEATVLIQDGLVQDIYWEKLRPKANTIVRATLVPRGGDGGKGFLGIFGAILVLAAAAFLPGLLGLTGVLAAIATPLISAVGLLAVRTLTGLGNRPSTSNSLTPSREAQEDEPNTRLQFARNDIRIGRPIPICLGKMRVTPPFGAPPVSRSLGTTNRISHLFVWSQGLCDISDLRIGDTPIDDFEDVRIFTRNGFPTQNNVIRGYTDQVTEESFQVLLERKSGWLERTAPPQSDRLGFDIGFNQLVFRGNLRLFPAFVTIEIQYREVGTGAWQSLPSEVSTTFPQGWRNGSGFDFRAQTQKQRVWGVEFDTPKLADWELRFQRITLDDDERTGDDVDRYSTESLLTAIRGFKDERPITFPRPLCMNTINIKGSGQLNGALDQLSGLLSARHLDWNGSAWVSRNTSNPASIARFLLTHPDNPEALVPNQLDLDAFVEFHEWCDEQSFEFNHYLEGQILFKELIDAVLGAGRGFKTLDNLGRFSIKIDREVDFPATTLCPRNLLSMEWNKSFPDLPHAFRAEFSDRSQDWRQDETIVYFPGFTAANASNIETVDKLGITKRNHLRRALVFDINQLVKRNILYFVETDWEVLPLERGSRVWLQHDILQTVNGSARILSLGLNGNMLETIEIDSPFRLDTSSNFTGVIRVPTLTQADRHITFRIAFFDGETTTITLVFPIDITTLGTVPARGDLVIYGITTEVYKDCLVRDIEIREESEARLTLVEYLPDKIYRNIVVPPDDPAVSGNPFVLPAPELTEPPVTDESVLEISADRLSAQERVFMKFRKPSDEFSNTVLDVQGALTVGGDYDDVDVTARTPTSLTIGGVQTDDTWNFRVRWTALGFLPSPWTYINGLRIVGRSNNPEPLTGVAIGNTGEQNVITWDLPRSRELDVQFGGVVCVRYSNDFAATFSETVEVAREEYVRGQIFLAPVNGIYYLKIVDSFGKFSTPTSIETNQISVIPYEGDVLATEHPSFSGTKTGLVVDTNTLKLDNTGLWDDRTGLWDDDTTTLWDSAGGQETEGTYDFANFVQYAQVETFRLTMELESFEVSNTAPLWDSVPGDWDDRVGLWDGDVGDFTEVEMWARITDDDPTGTPIWSQWFRITSQVVNARAAQGRIVIKSVSELYNRQVTFLRLVGNKV